MPDGEVAEADVGEPVARTACAALPGLPWANAMFPVLPILLPMLDTAALTLPEATAASAFLTF